MENLLKLHFKKLSICIATAMAVSTMLEGGECVMDEQSKIFLEQFYALNLPPLETLPVEDVRKIVEIDAWESQAAISEEKDIFIDGPQGKIPLRIYVPQGKGPFPVFVTFHGGGWVFGSLKLHGALCREIASQASVVVISVDYRLAPEHKFPAPLIDCYAAFEWAAHNSGQFKGDPKRLAVGGDSAGGNLAAAVTLMARDKKGPAIRHQVLIYPVTNYNFSTPSYEKYAENHFLTKSCMKWFWDLYLRSKEDADNPYASPLKAKDFSNLPSATIVLASFDPLFDEGLEYGNLQSKD